MALPLASPSLIRLPPGTPRGHAARTPSYALRALRTPGGEPGSPVSSWTSGERPNPFDDVRPPQGKRSSSRNRASEGSGRGDEGDDADDHAGSDEELVDAEGEDEVKHEPLERAINLVGMGARLVDESFRRSG